MDQVVGCIHPLPALAHARTWLLIPLLRCQCKASLPKQILPCEQHAALPIRAGGEGGGEGGPPFKLPEEMIKIQADGSLSCEAERAQQPRPLPQAFVPRL